MSRAWANTPAQTSGAVVIRNDLQRDYVGGIIMTNNGCLHATNTINGAGGVARGNSGGRWTIPRHRDVTRGGQPDAQEQTRMQQALRWCLQGVAATRRAVLKAPLAALVVGVLAGLGWSPIAHAGPVTDWNTLATDLVAAHQDPATQPHTLAIVHIAMHDALNAIALQYEPYAYAGSAPGASAAAAVAAAARDTLIPLLPAAAAAIDAEYTASLAAIPHGLAKDAGVLTGQAAAAVILALRRSDDLAVATTKPYTPGYPAPGVYQPTPPLNFVVLAGWGELTPFALSSNSQFRSPPALAVNSLQYTKDYHEVKDMGSLHSTTRTVRQSETARFWYDVRTKEWHRAAQTGLSHVSADEWRAARLLALVSIAMADGVIASFDTKFHDNYWRPITAIRAGDDDGNASTQGDPGWEPFCVTPPFPEHNSTHAVTAAAAATTLAWELGDRHTFTIDSPIGVSRTYTRFSRAAYEEAVSRIYCGIHFRHGMNAGLAQGAAIAHYTFENLLRPLDDNDDRLPRPSPLTR